MSKITFRADEDLVEEVERLDASKSEVMREALRTYLDGASDSVDDAIARRVDEEVAARTGTGEQTPVPDVNVNVTVETPDADDATAEVRRDREREPRRDGRDRGDDRTCAQCGEELASDHVFCPNCGEKSSHRFFCECGDELRSDWSHCPSCGRRTPSADVLDR